METWTSPRSTQTATGLASERPASRHREASSSGEESSKTSTQPSIALSSGEAEYSALVKAAAEGIGLQSILRDLGFETSVEVHTDSSAAKSIASLDRGQKSEAHPHEVALDSGGGSRRQNQVDEDLWRPQCSGRSEQAHVRVWNEWKASVSRHRNFVQETEMGRFGRRGAVRLVTKNERM